MRALVCPGPLGWYTMPEAVPTAVVTPAFVAVAVAVAAGVGAEKKARAGANSQHVTPDDMCAVMHCEG